MLSQMQDGGERMTYENGGMREPSTGKGAYELISPFALERIAMWYELGAHKYADRNWEKGIPFGRLIQSAIRHMIRWMKGDRSEDHLAAVCWNVMAMMHFEETGQAAKWNNYPMYKPVGPKALIVPAGGLDAATQRVAEAGSSHTPSGPYQRDYKIIAVDFDGCLCKNAWPEIGEANAELIDGLKFSRATGDKLILWTCREGKALDEAVTWCNAQGLGFDAVNANLPEMIAMYGNDSRKIGADWYLDDKAENVRA